MSDSQKPASSNGFGLVLGAIVLFGILHQCSSDKSTPSVPQSLVAQTATPPTVNYPEVLPLDSPSMKAATGHYHAVFAAAGLSGAVVYSQNCYDAVARAFSWAKLDRCGAFDMMSAEALLRDAADQSGNAANYFDSETSAARYIAAATQAGDTPDDVDQRLEGLQANAKIALVAKKKPSQNFFPESPEVADEALPLNDAAEAVAGVTNDVLINVE